MVPGSWPDASQMGRECCSLDDDRELVAEVRVVGAMLEGPDTEELGGVGAMDWFLAEIGVLNREVILQYQLEYIHRVLKQYGVEVAEAETASADLHQHPHILLMGD